MLFDVFLSHQGGDKGEIKQLAAYLEPDLACWYAPRNILESNNYGSEVLTGVEKSSVVLVYLTEKFEENPDNYVTNEVIHARSHKKRILPVLKGRSGYPRELEMHLNSYQWFNLNDYETVEEAWQQLRSVIRILLTDESEGLGAAEFLGHVRNKAIHIPEGLSQVSENLLNKHKHVFTPSIDFLQLNDQESIRVFYGRDLLEKTTQAINYLSGKNKKYIFEGLGIDSLKALATETFHQESGYFIHIDQEDLEKSISESFRENLSQRLKDAKAELVLCTDEPSSYFENSEIELPQDKMHYLLKQLSWITQEPEKLQEAEGIISQNSELLSKLNHSSSLVETVKQLARTVNGEQSAVDFHEAVVFLGQDGTALPFDLDREDNINDLLYSLAIALNHGKSYERIIESYDYLLTEFQKAYPAQQINYHTRSFSTLKRDFHLKVVNERVSNHLGSYIEDCVYYQNEMMADKVWPAVWTEYPYREYLATVLIGHLGSRYSAVVSRVEDIMYSIIDTRFEQGIDRLISPLGKSVNIGENLLAKQLLVRLYNDPNYKLKTIRLLKNWMFIRNKRLERTAMLTLQSKIGIENYQNTIGWLMELIIRNGRASKTLYSTLSYLSKYIYLDPQSEKVYYGAMKEKLADWRGHDVYPDYLKLIVRVMKDHPNLFYKTQSAFVESFLLYVIFNLVEQEQVTDAARTLSVLLVESRSYPSGKELYQSLLRKLKDKLTVSQFGGLIETIKKGDTNVVSL